jgi:hypothetical protein
MQAHSVRRDVRVVPGDEINMNSNRGLLREQNPT